MTEIQEITSFPNNFVENPKEPLSGYINYIFWSPGLGDAFGCFNILEKIGEKDNRYINLYAFDKNTFDKLNKIGSLFNLKYVRLKGYDYDSIKNEKSTRHFQSWGSDTNWAEQWVEATGCVGGESRLLELKQGKWRYNNTKNVVGVSFSANSCHGKIPKEVNKIRIIDGLLRENKTVYYFGRNSKDPNDDFLKKYDGNKSFIIIDNDLDASIVVKFLECERFIGIDSGMSWFSTFLRIPTDIVVGREFRNDPWGNKSGLPKTFEKISWVKISWEDEFVGGVSFRTNGVKLHNIRNIKYGRDEISVDVTDLILNKRIKVNDNLLIDSLAGDPLPGHIKNLHITYDNDKIGIISEGKKIKFYPNDTNLVYLTPFGSEYRKMARLCVLSMRTIGKYTGKIVIFTDEIDDSLREISNIADIVQVQFECHPLVARIYACDYINASSYQNIMYFDCDIFCMKEINTMFRAKNNVLYMEEPWHKIKNTWSGVIDTYYFNEEEMIKYGECHPINSGHYCVSGDYFDTFFKTYKKEFERKTKFEWGMDQSSLNSIVRKGYVNSEVFDKYEIGIPTRIPEEEYEKYNIVHFAGYANRLNSMEYLWFKMRK
jgi:hypothetical protein